MLAVSQGRVSQWRSEGRGGEAHQPYPAGTCGAWAVTDPGKSVSENRALPVKIDKHSPYQVG